MQIFRGFSTKTEGPGPGPGPMGPGPRTRPPHKAAQGAQGTPHKASAQGPHKAPGLVRKAILKVTYSTRCLAPGFKVFY